MTPETPTPDYGEPWGYDIDYDMALTKNGSVCDANRAVACVNACAGMTDPAAEIAVMREAIKEAASHLSGFLGFHADALSLDQVKALSATLDKLKPFLPDATPPKP